MENTCALLFHASVPKPYWSDAVLTASYLINCMPSVGLGAYIPHIILSPGKVLFHLSPKLFGCIFYFHILGPGGDRLDPRSLNVFFLGTLVLRRDTSVIPLLFAIIF